MSQVILSVYDSIIFDTYTNKEVAQWQVATDTIAASYLNQTVLFVLLGLRHLLGMRCVVRTENV